MGAIAERTAALTAHMKRECEKANVDFDTYDLDFIIGVQMGWLDDRGYALTGRGVKRISR